MTKIKRFILRVKWDKRHNIWVIRLIDGRPASFKTKAAAVAYGRDIGQAYWGLGQPAQLLIYNKDGRIGTGRNAEASYGCDSRTPG